MDTKLIFRLLSLTACLFLKITASAYHFMVDGLCYNYNIDGTGVTVTAETTNFPTTDNPSYSNLSGDLIIPEAVTYSGTTYSVTSIGYCAFLGCSGLTSVTIGNSVTSIGIGAFSSCSGLTRVTIPNSVTSIEGGAFEFCSGLKSVTIGNSVTSIEGGAFRNCSGLTSVTIPNSVTSIGNNALQGCSGLESISVESGNSVYDSRDNCNAIIETASNTLVACCKNTVIPNSITAIGDYAFAGCSWLTSMTIPNTITCIGNYAFSGCNGLTSVTIPNSVTYIGNNAFHHCSGLTSVTIGNSVTAIGDNAFEGCNGLTSVTIPNSVTSIGNYAFSGTAWYNNQPDGLVYAGSVAYQYKGTMPSGTSIVIINGTKGIAGSCFYYFSGLTSVTIPNSVSNIGKYAFFECNHLADIYSEISHPRTITVENSVFSSDIFTTCVLHVPSGTKQLYQSLSPWNKFVNIVESSAGNPIDINADGSVDISDVNAVINFMLGKVGVSEAAADINNDGIVDIFDVNEVINAMLGME